VLFRSRNSKWKSNSWTSYLLSVWYIFHF